MSIVLDASAALALILKEPGSEIVEAALGDAIISSVNMAEVYAKCADRGLDPAVVKAMFSGLGVTVSPFTDMHALASGRLRGSTRAHGLSLGDRACLALAVVEKAEVLTADKVWLKLGLNIAITAIR